MAELLGEVQIKRTRKPGPTGKVHKVLEEVSKLSGSQQAYIIRVVSALVMPYEQRQQRRP